MQRAGQRKTLLPFHERTDLMKLRLGMSPISWTNDDLPQLGGDTPLSVCLSQTREAGFVGTELGGKFPVDAHGLSTILQEYDLVLVSGWYSGTLINNTLEDELDRIQGQLSLFKACNAPVIVYGETYNTVQNRQDKPLSARPKLGDFDAVAYGKPLSSLSTSSHVPRAASWPRKSMV